nr:cyclase family protein [Microbacterium pseudoresistens]
MRHDELPGFEVQTFFRQEPTGVFTDPAIGSGTDHVRLDAHGIDNTHIDALNHTAVDGRWYGGSATDTPGLATLAELAVESVVGRAVHLDLAAARGVEWVSVDQPVTAEDLRRALESTGRTIESGDVLMLDLGRDRYVAAGGPLRAERRPGVGESGARWLSAQPIAAVAWDLLDAKHPDEPPAAVHLLNWAIGLVLIDNCDFSRARDDLAAGGHAGMFVAAPLPIRGATGGNVNPMVIV